MDALFGVVVPVFLVIGAGYLMVRARLLNDAHVDGLMLYTQGFAIPCLLFKATSTLDLGAVFSPGLLFAFYGGATVSFFLGIVIARRVFRRRPGEAVAIGFGALFSNSVMLGLPIIERAYGPAALAPAFAIVAIHAPYCYALGITVMEISRADGAGPVATTLRVLRTMFRNALMIGLALGFTVNLTGFSVPVVVRDGVDFVVQSALPAALFGLGGVLVRYRIGESLGAAAVTSVLSLVVHPGVTFLLATQVLDLPPAFTQVAVLTAAMAPGINTYVFANLYNRAVGVAASTVIIATVLSLFSVALWLTILEISVRSAGPG